MESRSPFRPDDPETQAPSQEPLSVAIALALPLLAAALAGLPIRHGRGTRCPGGGLSGRALGRTLLLPLLGLGTGSWLVWWTGEVDHRREEAQDGLALYGLHLILGVLWSWMLFGRGWVGLAFLKLVGLVGWVQVVASRFRGVNPVARMLLLPYQVWLLFLVVWNGLLWRRCCGARQGSG